MTNHLLTLILRYFIRNRRRTLRAVIIMGIGLSLILSTHMLLSGFLIQIEEFAGLIDNPSRTLYLVPDPDMETDQLEAMERELRQIRSAEVISLRYEIQAIQNDAKNQSTVLLQTDLLMLQKWNWISFNNSSLSNTLFISQLTGYEVEKLVFYNFSKIIRNIETVNILEDITSDLLIDDSYNDYQIPNKSQIVLRVFSDSLVTDVRKISEKYSTELIEKEPSNVFLEITADQITNILILLQIAMSFLLVLSISYVMITLVSESSDDLRILHMIGYGKSRVFVLLLSQTLLSALLSIIGAFLFSILFLQTIIPFLTYLELPYSLIYIDLSFLLVTSLQAIIVGFIAGLYPAKLGAEFFG